MANEAGQEIRVPIRHDLGEAKELGPNAVYPDRMEITILPKARQIVVAERWFVRLATRKDHVYGNTQSDIRDEAVINNYFAQFREAALHQWNGKLQLLATEKGHQSVTYDLVFMIERTRDWQSRHWEIVLQLYNKDYAHGHGVDSTNWTTGTIELHMNSAALRNIDLDIKIKKMQTYKGVLSKTPGKVHGRQTPVAHEFGHTLGLSPGLAYHADEYHKTEYWEGEIRQGVHRSVMNIGNQIETKHADYIVSQLNRYYASLRNNSVEFSARRRK